MAVQFSDSQSQAIPLNKLKVVASNMDDTYGNITIQTLDNLGYTKDSYTWTNEGGESWDQTGWVDNNAEEFNALASDDVLFNLSDGLWVSSLSDDVFIQISGLVDVNNNMAIIHLLDGFRAVGSPFPTTIKLNNMVPSFFEGSDLSMDDVYNAGITLQTLDNLGYTKDSYTWTNEGGESWDEIGWVDNNAEEFNTLASDKVEFSENIAFWVSGYNGMTLIIYNSQDVE